MEASFWTPPPLPPRGSSSRPFARRRSRRWWRAHVSAQNRATSSRGLRAGFGPNKPLCNSSNAPGDGSGTRTYRIPSENPAGDSLWTAVRQLRAMSVGWSLAVRSRCRRRVAQPGPVELRQGSRWLGSVALDRRAPSWRWQSCADVNDATDPPATSRAPCEDP